MLAASDIHIELEGSSVVRGVSLSLAPGELVALVGANGSGKSTLGRALCGSLMVTGGSIEVNGVDPAAGADERRQVRRLVGLVRQDPSCQIVSSLVDDEVAFGPRNIGCDEDEVRSRTDRALARAGAAALRGRSCEELSGGELQRVALAGVLAMEPRYLVLDEVTAQLDSSLRPAFRTLARNLAHDEGLGVLCITHDALEVMACDRVLMLAEGHVVWQGTPAAFVRTGQMGPDALLGADDPYAAALCAAVRAGFDPAQGVEPDQLASWLCAASDGRRDVLDEARRRCDPAHLRTRAGQGPGTTEASMAPGVPSAPEEPVAEAPAAVEAPAGTALTSALTEASVAESIPAGATAAEAAAAEVPAGASSAPTKAPVPELLLELSGVSCSYTAAPVLEALDFCARAGSVVLLAGCSGSGKSTLATVAAGLREPDAGHVRIAGVPARPGACGLAWQNPEAQFFLDTVFDEIAFAPRNLGADEREVAARVDTAAQAVGLEAGLLERYPFELSGGQARRVAIASVLSLAAPVLVLDEPTAGLDASGRRFVRALVRDLARSGRAVVVISHDVGEWLSAVDEVALLAEGRICWRGAPSQVGQASDAFAHAGLLLPESARLYRALAARACRNGAVDASASACAAEPAPVPAGAFAGELAAECAEDAGTEGAAIEAPAAPAHGAGTLATFSPVMSGSVPGSVLDPARESEAGSAHNRAPVSAPGSEAAAAHGSEPAPAPSRPQARAGRGFHPLLGAYIPSSPLAGIDARVKLGVFAAICIGAFATGSWWGLAAWTAALAGAAAAARMRPAMLVRALRPAAIVLAFALFANLISCDGRATVALAGPVGLNPAGGLRGLAAALRIALLLGFSLVVASSTTATQISDACMRLLRPCRRVGVPVAQLGCVLSLALRFIPLTGEEVMRIHTAQRARGVRFDSGGLAARGRAWVAVLAPMVVGLLRRADRLGEAMAARCYPEGPDAPLVAPHALEPREWLLLAGGVLLAAALPLASVWMSA